MSPSVPQGQGHRTVLAQVVADVLGLTPSDIRVNAEIDTAKDAWSIASGNYRQPLCAGRRRHHQACRRTDRLAPRPGGRVEPEHGSGRHRLCRRLRAVEAQSGQQGRVLAGRGAEPLVARRVAGRHRADHFAKPCSGRRRSSHRPTMPITSTHRSVTASSSTSAALRSTRVTLQTRIDRYVTMHDCGTILHPADGRRPGARRFRASDRRRAL